jgi:hypothetical protein
MEALIGKYLLLAGQLVQQVTLGLLAQQVRKVQWDYKDQEVLPETLALQVQQDPQVLKVRKEFKVLLEQQVALELLEQLVLLEQQVLSERLAPLDQLEQQELLVQIQQL